MIMIFAVLGHMAYGTTHSKNTAVMSFTFRAIVAYLDIWDQPGMFEHDTRITRVVAVAFKST